MTDLSIIPVRYEGEGRFAALNAHWAGRCDTAFGKGEVLRFTPWEERSIATHRHFFAILADAWESLPDSWAAQFPTPEHLRKFCLIKSGHCDTDTLVASSKAEAGRLAAFVASETYSLVVVKDAVVTRYRARSMSMRAVNRKDFAALKEKVFDVLSGMLGCSAEDLARREREAA